MAKLKLVTLVFLECSSTHTIALKPPSELLIIFLLKFVRKSPTIKSQTFGPSGAFCMRWWHWGTLSMQTVWKVWFSKSCGATTRQSLAHTVKSSMRLLQICWLRILPRGPQCAKFLKRTFWLKESQNFWLQPSPKTNFRIPLLPST